jgi:phospholipid/cholesterol/gamma-HCH transport system ATP-binding protein
MHESAAIADAPERQSVVRIRELSSHYGERQVLHGINLEVRAGEILAVMGPSGCGKTTLFRHILGLKAPSSGNVEVLGRQMSGIGKKALYDLRKRIGVAFQNGALLSSLSVRENVELPLREHTALDEATIRIMTRMKLDFMRLGDFEDLMPSQLSGGMLKRAGLARAVIMDPKLLFFDEPSAGLDPVTSAELDQLILKLRDALNITVVIITHELHSVFSVADRITILDRGRQILTGTRDEVRASTDRRVVDMLERRPRDDEFDAQAHLERLTGGPAR